MRRWRYVVGAAMAAALFAACDLNPQPLPPETEPAASPEEDAGSAFGGRQDASAEAPPSASDAGTNGMGADADSGDGGDRADGGGDSGDAADAADAH